MSVVVGHEEAVRNFYDDDGEGAARAYDQLMGRMWFHGDRLVEEETGSPDTARHAMLRWIGETAKLTAGTYALEFGAGTGGGAVELAATTGAVVVGVSNADSPLRRARELATERGLDGRAVFTTIGDLDYKHFQAWPDGALDAVLFMESVCHLPDQAAFFRAAHRIVKPGGWLVGMDWIQRPYGDRRTPEAVAELAGPVIERFRLASLGTVESYATMMTDAGFRVTFAEDEYPGLLCLGATEPTATWQAYEGTASGLHESSKAALDAARAGGIFSVARWAAQRPE
jgi:cyclopropane fatty-acyl-phospholipid synthase-like methyltransferase